MAGIGDNSGEVLNSTAQTQLKTIIERVERLEEDKAAIQDDIKEVVMKESKQPDWFWVGFQITWGVLACIVVMSWIGQGITWVQGKIFPTTIAHDNSDPTGGHSGMDIKTDHLTGCQYFVVSFNLTPRLGVTGLPMCGVK